MVRYDVTAIRVRVRDLNVVLVRKLPEACIVALAAKYIKVDEKLNRGSSSFNFQF
jgi:hypothetical protein